ncbi:hypothetical protein ACHAXS_013286 [Conticribra weissflogii]
MLRLIPPQSGRQRRRRHRHRRRHRPIFLGRSIRRPKNRRLPRLDIHTGKSPIQTHHVHQPGIDPLSYIRRKRVRRIPHQGHAGVPVVRPNGQARTVLAGGEPRPLRFGESLPFVFGDERIVGGGGGRKVESGKGPLEVGSHGISVPNGPYLVIRTGDDVGGSDGIVVFHGQESEGEVVPRSGEGGANGVDSIRGGLDGRFASGVGNSESGRELEDFDAEVGGRRGVFFESEGFGFGRRVGPLGVGGAYLAAIPLPIPIPTSSAFLHALHHEPDHLMTRDPIPRTRRLFRCGRRRLRRRRSSNVLPFLGNLLSRIARHDHDLRIGETPTDDPPLFELGLHGGEHAGQSLSAGVDQVEKGLGGVVVALGRGSGRGFEEGDVVGVASGEDERGGEADGAGSDDYGVFALGVVVVVGVAKADG